MEVLQFLLLPKECYHITLKKYFENPHLQGGQEPCLSKYSFCWADHLELTTKFKCPSLVSFLSTKVFLQGPITVAKLVKLLGDNKGKLFTTPVYNLTRASSMPWSFNYLPQEYFQSTSSMKIKRVPVAY
jgi:hypothetical protein